MELVDKILILCWCYLLPLSFLLLILVEIIDSFRRYDVYVDNQFFRECKYKLHEFTGTYVEITNPRTGVYLRIYYDSFVIIRSYWKWNKPPEEVYLDDQK